VEVYWCIEKGRATAKAKHYLTATWTSCRAKKDVWWRTSVIPMLLPSFWVLLHTTCDFNLLTKHVYYKKIPIVLLCNVRLSYVVVICRSLIVPFSNDIWQLSLSCCRFVNFFCTKCHSAVGIVDNIDHRGFYRSCAVIFGYRRDFASRQWKSAYCV